MSDALAGRPGWNKGMTFPAETLSEAEVRALLGAISSKSSLGLRNRALIIVLYRGGLRVSEALALRPKDVDLASGSIRVLKGKGGKARTVSIDPGAVDTLARWVERRAGHKVPAAAPLFCDLQGKGIGAPAVRSMLSRAACRAGVEKRVHPHGLRHTMARELALEGIAMPVVQQQLGHSSLAVTGRYLTSIGATEVQAAISQREWSPEASNPQDRA